MRLFTRLVFIMLFTGSVAHAQSDTSALMDRLDRLERDVTFVQKQIYRGSAVTGASSGALPANAGQVQVRMAQIDEEIRQIRGLIEQTQFQNRQTATELKKLSEDVDFRLRAIEEKQLQAATTPTEPTTTGDEAITTPAAPEKPATYTPEPTKPAVTGRDFPDSNAHYSHAFKLLNEKKFAEAATSFDAFVKKYPADPLTANAFYWLGESQYARGDFTRATESFRKGFEVNPEGQKAPDNLYKLAVSLGQIKRQKEACVVLNRVIEKYSETATRTAVKAEDARISMQCK